MMIRGKTDIRSLIFGCVMQLMTHIGRQQIIQERIKVQDRIRIDRMQPDIVEGEQDDRIERQTDVVPPPPQVLDTRPYDRCSNIFNEQIDLINMIRMQTLRTLPDLVMFVMHGPEPFQDRVRRCFRMHEGMEGCHKAEIPDQ